MSSYAPNDSGGTTEHIDEIARMRAQAHQIIRAYPDVNTCPAELRKDSVLLMAGAALLEVHDASGISLDSWGGPHAVVVEALELIGEPRETFLPNGV